MKLRFDANLSRRIVPLLIDLFPGSLHIVQAGFAGDTEDAAIWEYAMQGLNCVARRRASLTKAEGPY